MNTQNINQSNYEVFFLDYHEGQLNELEKSEVLAFLEVNPQLKDEFYAFESVQLNPEEIAFDEKPALKQIPQSSFYELSEFEYLCAGKTENNLSESEFSRFSLLLKQSPQNNALFEQILQTKLLPDAQIVFPNKKKLKRFSIFSESRSIVRKTMAAAAILAVFGSGFYYLTNSDSSTEVKTISSTISSSKIIDIEKPESIFKKVDSSVLSSVQKSKNPFLNTVITDSISDLTDNQNTLFASIEAIDIKSRTSYIETNNLIEIKSIPGYLAVQAKEQRKELVWIVAENAVKLWNFSTKGNLEMNNRYNEKGEIEKLNLYTANFKISKTYKKF
jgi:hypothetical protein